MILQSSKLTTAVAGFFLILFINSISCKKVTSNAVTQPGDTTRINPPDLTTKVNASVSGFVIDQSGIIVSGATVSLGNSSTVTDKYGYFEIRNALVIKQAAVVTVQQPGYMKCIKTFIAAEGKNAFFRIILYTPDYGSVIDATAGGSASPYSDLIVTIPANAVVNAVTRLPYSGLINISTTHMVPGQFDLSIEAPGDGRGLDSLGLQRWLQTYGIVSIECKGSAGELLQLADGKQATITIPVPASYIAGAPPKIPLWNFNEMNGLWKQEGTALQSGNNYVAVINQFSMWNCAMPAAPVHFSCTITDATLKPIPYVWVKVSDLANPDNAIWFFTDSAGNASGLVQDNKQLTAEVSGNYLCTLNNLSKNFTTSGSDVSLGNLVVPATNIATVSGTLATCSGGVVTNGFVMMQKVGYYNNNFRFTVTGTGSFSFSTILCENTPLQLVILHAVDNSAMQTGNDIMDTLQTGINNLGNIGTCGNTALVQFTGKLIDASGNPVSNEWVKVSNTSSPQKSTVWSFSDTSGLIKGSIPQNSQFLLEAFSTQNCNGAAFSKTFATTNSNIPLGDLTLSGLLMATVTGNVTDCNGAPVTNGYVLLKKDINTFSYPLSNTGTFSITTSVCNGSNTEPVSLVAVDNSKYTTGNITNMTLTPGNNVAGTLNACATPVSTGQFINYILDGVSYSFVSPADAFTEQNNMFGSPYFWNLLSATHPDQSYIEFVVIGDPETFVPGSNNAFLDEFSFSPGYDRHSAVNQVTVNISETGAVGQYIAGNFTIDVINNADNTIHNVICIFRVKRLQ